MLNGATRRRSRNYARDAAQMAERRSSVKCDNIFPEDEGCLMYVLWQLICFAASAGKD
jgi:hypothetical protein